MEIFGYKIGKKVTSPEEGKADEKINTPIPRVPDEGSIPIAAGAGYYGQYFDLSNTDGVSDADLITKYRQAAAQPECDAAIADIVDGAIASSDTGAPVDLRMDDLDIEDSVKQEIVDEFNNILKLFKFNRKAADIFRTFYVDGRLHYHIVTNPASPSKGIAELRWVDPTLIKKVHEVKEEIDPRTKIKTEKIVSEYYLYTQNFTMSGMGTAALPVGAAQSTLNAVKIDPSLIITVNSGIYDPTRKKVVSHMHKALKIINQLRMMEDGLVIYRISRSPERRIFYIDVGNLPAAKAEQYVQSVVAKFRNKLVYDANTGSVSDDRRHMSMLEDFYLPRKEGGKGTEISTLPGGENLGQIEDIVYFQKRLYGALNVPLGRLETASGFSLGRASEISREEVKFQKFIDRLRKQFAQLLISALKVQLILKNVITLEDWADIEESISVDFVNDSYFTELKESEILRERLNTLATIDPYIGKYFSLEFVRTKVLMQSFEDMKQIDEQIADEKASGRYADLQSLNPGGDSLPSSGFDGSADPFSVPGENDSPTGAPPTGLTSFQNEPDPELDPNEQ